MTSLTKTICFFNSNRAWGGGEKWHFTTAKEFQRRGYTSILCTNNGSQLYHKARTERMNVYSFSVQNLSFINPFKILVMVAFLKSKKVDAIILNLPSDLKLAGIAAKLAGVKKIIYRRGMPHPLRNTWLNRFLFQKILTHVVVNSQEIGRTLMQGNEEWFPKEKMVLIYNGVDTSITIDKTRKLYQKQGDELVIGNAGRLTEQKGQKYLIEISQLLKKDGVNFKMLIAGEGELRGVLERMINENGLADQVKLIGHVEDMTAFFNSLDVFAFTSLYEGSANTLVECLQHEVPCVAWDVSSNPEVIRNCSYGALVKLSDTIAMAKRIVEYGQQTNSISLLRSKDGILQNEFSLEKNLNKLQNILLTLEKS